MATKIRIFLDTSAITAGIWSERGGGRMLLQLGEAGAVSLFTNRLAIHELEGALRVKAPEALGALALLLDRADIVVADDSSGETLTLASSLTGHPGDARILAAAIDSGPEYFVTLDRKHFLDNRDLVAGVQFLIGTPGECLEWLRKRFRGMARGGE